jgi:hypothetical protein
MAENGPIEIGVRVDVDQASKSIQNFSKQSRTSLTSLSLVLQDLPFGFIGIQNNLPGVIQSFGQLTKESGGLKGAISAIGASLVGPAGLFLAFSALTAAVTVAVQKYGSLGAAFDALTGNTNEFTEAISKADKSLAEYNKVAKSTIELRNNAIGSVEDEIIKINSLADVLRSSTTTDRQKQGALAELKKANDEYFGKLNAQKIDVDLLNESIGKYTESLIKNKVAQNLASEAAGIFTEFLKQNQIAVDISQQINKLTEQYPNLTKRVQEYFDTQERIVKQGGVPFGPKDEVARFIELNDQLKSVNVNVKSTADSYGLLKTQADAAFKSASGFLDLPKDKVGKTEGPKVDKDYERFLELTRQSNLRLAEFYAKQLQIQADKNLQKKLKDDAAAFKLFEQATLAANDANNEFGIGLQNQIASIDTTYANATIATGQIIQRFTDAQNIGINQFARIQEQIKGLEQLKSTIESNLTRPFRDFFDELLTNGKISFDGFVELAKDAFKRILAQALASGIANLLASLLSGGATAGLGKLGAAKGIAAILSGLGKTGSLLGSANFSGVQGAGMQMAGAVNLTLRGSDLVGAINRTNSTINRVG